MPRPKGKVLYNANLQKSAIAIAMAKKGYADPQICAYLSMTPGSVRSTLNRARQIGHKIPYGPERKANQLTLLTNQLSKNLFKDLFDGPRP